MLGDHQSCLLSSKEVLKTSFQHVLLRFDYERYFDIFLLDFSVAKVNLLSHVKKRTLSQLEVVHGLRSLSSENNDTEAIRE